MEDLQKQKISVEQRKRFENEILEYRKSENLSILLDNSLIFQSNNKRVDKKIIYCGDYIQIYNYKHPHVLKDKNLEVMKDFYNTKTKEKRKPNKNQDLRQLEEKNLLRSKFELQRLVKTNIKDFKTFLTLTFADNVTSIEQANKQFNIWRTYIKQLKSDFKCVGVPEFQKRGAVHYHLLTNIDYNDDLILSQEEIKIYNKYSGWQVGKNVKGWSYGYSMCKNMEDINVIGYISKYMTKDIDNRLWGKRRYFYTRNLKRPQTFTIDITKLQDFALYVDLLTKDYEEQYSSSYTDFLGHDTIYTEYRKEKTL